MALTLYEMAAADPQRRFSPYCWRIRMALAHKGLEYQTQPVRFMDKPLIAESGQDKVPVLVHDGKWLSDSWTIANYLETTFPDRPSLFGGPQGLALSRMYSSLGDVLGGQILRFVLMDVYRHLHEGDLAYFRESREARLKAPLEQVVEGREQRLPEFRAGLAPLRLTLSAQPYFGGDAPMYADYALFGAFQWARCISPFQLLEPDDPIALWRGRLLQAYDGLAAAAPGYD